MMISPMTEQLALELAVTIRHDGAGGVTDDLETVDGLAQWLRGREERLRSALDAGPVTADETVLSAVREVRTAVRALFARAVAPRPASRADAGRLPTAEDALQTLARAAGRVPTAPRLDWPEGGEPVAVPTAAAPASPADRVAAALALAAVALLTGPGRARLRACPAPRCVRYFLQDHPRQEWCKPSCGNRARVARHHARHRDRTGGPAPGAGREG